MKRLALAVVAAIGAVCARAEAYPVTLRLIDTVYNANAMDAGFKNGSPLGAFQLTIDSAAVSRGSFSIHGFNPPGGGSTIAGDLIDFISATTVFGDNVSPTIIYSTFNTQLTFDSAGSGAGTIDFGSLFNGQTISGNAARASGTFGGDGTGCDTTACGVTGRLMTTGYTPAAVPEPASVALLLAGLVGLDLGRRRR